MNDEQTILLGPEEELTSVRERLNKTQARRIILVIPPQTQLRSHVGWRLIHARMRELGKEVLVISPDRQIRAMARAAGFQVAETQEVPSNRPRLGGGTRPGGINTRTAGSSRRGASRGEPESQAPQPGPRRRFTPNTASKPLTSPPFPARQDDEDEETFESPGTGPGIQKLSPNTFYEEPEERFSRAYDFGISATPSVRPSMPHRDEDEDDEDFKNTYEADYHTAQSILKAAREGSKPALGEIEASVPDIAERPTVEMEMESDIEDLGDLGSIELPEIRSGQASGKPGNKQREQGRQPRPGSGPMQPPARRSPRAPRQDYDDDEEVLPLPDRTTRGAPGRSSRGLAGQNQRPSQTLKQGTSQRPSQGLKQGTSQRPSQGLKQGTSQRPSQSLKPGAGQRPSQGLSSAPGKRASQPIAPGQGQRTSQPIRTNPASQAGAGTRGSTGGQRPPATPIRQQPASMQRAPRRSRRGMVMLFTALALLLLVAIALFYFVPSATVTIALRASTYTQTVQLNATTNAQANVPNKVMAHTLEHDFSVSNQGNASGTTRVGNAKAQGFVTFTNSGNADVTIPSSTLIATLGGTQFVTGAEALVLHNSTLPAVPVPVIAQQPGEGGNVAAGSISVIPLSSLASIAQRSGLDPATITASNLTVTNEKATNGGGATNVPQVTQRDLQALAAGLHKQVQRAVQAWLDQQVQNGDVRGKLIPDVLASVDLLKEEQLSAVPPVGQPTSPSGAFSGTLTLHVSVLIARKADLQASAGNLLNTAALHMHPAKVLTTQLSVVLTHIQSTPAPDGSTLAISADASGAIIPHLDLAAISSSLINKSISQAESDLKNGIGAPNLQGVVQDVQISISPSFLSILPIQAGRIQIKLHPTQETPPQHLQNGT